ncbi:MAG: hypothetical protein KAH18_04455 [Psychromonas sp.]|nr:hypothetical protein [Psychromonas sp.]
MKKHFILKFKNKRLIALNREDKLQGRFHRIISFDCSETSICAWIKAMDVAILLHRQMYKKNKNVMHEYYI